MRLVIDLDRCTGCRLCAIYCSVRHRGRVDPSRANIAVLTHHEEHRRVPFTCFQCPDAPCQAACPTEAIRRDGVTGALTVDAELCVACGACVQECPYGNMLLFDGDECATKCDLCSGEPECAAVCPQEAITVVDGRSTAADIETALEAAWRALGTVPARRAPGLTFGPREGEASNG